MNKKRIVIMILAIFLVNLLVTACNSTSNKLENKVATGSVLTREVFVDPLKPIMENDQLQLFLDENMSVRVINKKSGVVWSTNPKNNKGDFTKNQFTLSYYDETGAYSTMNSQDDCVDKGQAKAYLENNALYIEYRLGQYDQTVEDVPSKISKSRFDEKFTKKLSPEDLEIMQSYYKFYEEENKWIIRSKGANNFQKILELMEKAGYTADDLTIDNVQNGVTEPQNKKIKFLIVLEYHLNEDGFTVDIPTERIAFESRYPIYEISMLNNFGKMNQSMDGYVFLPDGCGTLMNFSSEYNKKSEITMPVYGYDKAVASEVFTNAKWDYEPVLLPVFGMKDGKDAYLASITGAESKATIHAHQSGDYYGRNAVYPSFRLISKDNVYLSGSDSSSTVLMFQNKLFQGACSVRYQLLDGDSGYVEMAQLYRTTLEKDGKLKKLDGSVNTTPLLLETINGVKGYKNFMGISYTGINVATSYEENITIASDLMNKGIKNIEIKLTGWFNDGFYHSYPDKVSLERQLGGKNGWAKLLAFCKEKKVSIYPDVDFLNIKGNTLGFIAPVDAARCLDFSEVTIPTLSKALLTQKSDVGLTPEKFFVIAPAKLNTLTEKFIKSYSSINTGGISLRTSGNELYSDFRDTGTIDRTISQNLILEHVKKLQKSDAVMVSEGYQYVFPYVDRISNIPLDCSNYNTTEEAVPFLQIVLHGMKQMYGEAVNLAIDPDEYVLRSIEYGIPLNYQLTFSSADVLKNSEYTENYSSCFNDWKESIVSSYNKVQDALAGLSDCYITDHNKIEEGVYSTKYSNGSTIYVNYKHEPVTIDGKTIPSGGYLRTEGENK